jgi:outer membrane protein OmpA-like peptidoglycan-associated protein
MMLPCSPHEALSALVARKAQCGAGSLCGDVPRISEPRERVLDGRRVPSAFIRATGSCQTILSATLLALLLANLLPATSLAQPTEQEMLDALKAHRLVRCPTSGCGAGTPESSGIANEIPFVYGSATPSPAAKAALAALADALSRPERKGATLLIAGHTDAKGGVRFNQRLSERRARAVKQILVSQFAVSATSLSVVGYGKTRLKNTADPFAGENRRVQIVNAEEQAAAGDNR